MEHIKTYEGFFDFFKKKISEDDKILNDYIRRLKRIKGISPYEIVLDTEDTEEGERYYVRYYIIFEDAPLRIRKATSDGKYIGGWDDDTQKRWTAIGGIKKDNHTFYRITVSVMGEDILIKTSVKKVEELFNLIEDVYQKDKDTRRIESIRVEMNPAADRLDPDIYGDKLN